MIKQALHFQQHSTGVTLTEYALVGASVALVSIAGLLTLGSNTNSLLDGFAASLAYHAPSAPAVSMPGSGSISSPQPPSTAPPDGAIAVGGPVLPPDTQQQVCFKSGWCTEVPEVKSRTLDDTTGGMGSQLTHEFSDVIRRIAQQAEAMPNPDSRLVELITTLANSGHTLGDQEGQAVTSCMPGTQCTGNQSTLRDSLSLVISKQSMFTSDLQTLQNYVNENPGTLPPEMSDLINFEAQEITNIAGGYHGQPSPSEDGAYLQWSFSQKVQVTHQDSNTICNTGGSRGQCVRS